MRAAIVGATNPGRCAIMNPTRLVIEAMYEAKGMLSGHTAPLAISMRS